MKQMVVCAGCKKETSNPYSRRGQDGIERQYCHKCSENELKKLLDRERLQAWNAWAK